MIEPCSRAGVATARFIVRALCDDKGQPSTGRILSYPWLAASVYFYPRALQYDSETATQAVIGWTMVTVVLLLWNAAMKLGISFFVPVAEAVAGAFTKVAGTAKDLILGGMSRYGGGPDRTVGLTDPGGELHRHTANDPRQPDPFRDDERGEL